MSGGVASTPDVGCVPTHPPLASQLCRFDPFHWSVTESPRTTLLPLEVKLSVGVPVVSVTPACEFVTLRDIPGPHAVNAATTKPNIDFNASAGIGDRPRRIEVIVISLGFSNGGIATRVVAPQVEITYSFDISNLPTCRHSQTL